MKILHYLIAVLLFACLLDWSYGYYQFVRWAAALGFLVLANDYQSRSETTIALVLVGLAILFQPIAKVALGREMWNVVDVVVGLWLLWLATCRKVGAMNR
ncbi:MAG: DUF6804 family protein [Bacteroidota bacterium]